MSSSALPLKAPGRSGAPEVAARDRNGFIDAVRTVAILRIIVWHTYGFVWLSYLVASMPAMFFLAGSLMAYSLRRGGSPLVLYRRFRRLLIPFWLLAAAAVIVMLAYDRASGLAAATFHPFDIVWWVFPIWDPTGSEWGLTMWAPLWYIRCLAWLLLATPLLLWAWRRIGPALLLVPLLGLAIAEQRLRADVAVPWQLQDLALYGFFWMLGFAYNDGGLSRLRTPVRAGLCLLFSGAAAVWALTQDVPGNVVNSSYPLHLFVGLAWLFGGLAVEAWISRAALRPGVSSVLYWVNERALTIYLWQALGLFAMYQILWADPHSAFSRTALGLPIVASITFLAVLLLGWLEDVAAGRKPRLWPARATPDGAGRSRLSVRPALLAGGIASVGIVALTLAANDVIKDPTSVVQASAQTVPPSGAALHFRAEHAKVATSEPERQLSGLTGPATQSELQAEMEAWWQQWNLLGATASLRRPNGEQWTGAVGVHDTDAPFVPGESYPIVSVTKTFTSALILRLAERRLLKLDDRASKFVPDFPAANRFTIRQLLQHTSGMISGPDLPFQSLNQAALLGLQFEPGKGYLYSRTGYYMLGLVIESVLGEPYVQALRREFIDPLALSQTYMDEDIFSLPYSTHPYGDDNPEHPGVIWTSGGLHRDILRDAFDYRGILWSAGGIWSNTEDLTTWALALWNGEDVLSRSSVEAMTTFREAEFDYTGLGVYPFCPCWREKGQLRAERWGFAGSTGILEYDPRDRIALAVYISGTIFDENVIAALDDFSMRMRLVVRERSILRD